MERKRSLSASSSDSWSVIDHRRTSSCDDTADEAEESVSLYFDEAIIADEAFASSDEENEMNESDVVEDSDIELAEENISDSENEDADDQHEDVQEVEEETDCEEEKDSDWSSDEQEEEEMKESVWVDREDIRESGGLYFESPEHIKSNFDEIDRKEGWKLVSRVLTIYFSIIAVLLAVEAGLQMYKRNVPEPDYPVLIADIYGLQYRGVDIDSDDLPSFACSRNESGSIKFDNVLFKQPLSHIKYFNSTVEDAQDVEIYQGFSTYVFKSITPRRNSSRFQVLSRLVQSKAFTSPISFKSSLCYRTSIAPKVSNQTNFCLKWQQSFTNDKKIAQLQSIELLPQLVPVQNVPVHSDICVRKSNEKKRHDYPMSARFSSPSEKVRSLKLKREQFKTSNKGGPRAPQPVQMKQSPIAADLPSRRIRLSKPKILVAPPRNRLTMPKPMISSEKQRRLTMVMDDDFTRQMTLIKPRAVSKKQAHKRVRYSLGPVIERSIAPCHSKKSYLPSFNKRKLRLTKPFSSSNERASIALHGLFTNKTSQSSEQCDSRLWRFQELKTIKKRIDERRRIKNKVPTPCAAPYKIESSIAKRKQDFAERRVSRNISNVRSSSFTRGGLSKKAVVPKKKIGLSKYRSELKPCLERVQKQSFTKHHSISMKRMVTEDLHHNPTSRDERLDKSREKIKHKRSKHQARFD